MKYNLHTMKVTHFNCTSQWFCCCCFVFGKFTESGNHHQNLVLQQFCYPSKILHVHWQLTPVSYPPVPDQPVICFPSLIGLPFLDISYKWNHAKLVFCVWLLSISMKFIHVVAYISFSFLFIAEWCSIVWTHHIVFVTFQLMDIWAVYTLGLSWIRLLWTFMCKSLNKHMFPFLSGIYIRVELLHHMIKSMSNFLRNYQTVFTSAAPFYVPCDWLFHMSSVSLYRL